MLQQIVQTSLSLAGGSAYSAGLAGMAQNANALSGSMRMVTSLSGGMRAGLAALGGALSLSALSSLGSSFENTQLKMAGFFTALGESSDIHQGLALADVTMRKIEITAARLPGEAEDYVRVFSQGLPQIQKAVGGSLDDMLGFTNKITAIGSTFGIDSVQISHDLQRMLQVGKGGAGLDVRTFTEMLPFLQQVEGQANLNTEAFNKMTNVERAELLKKSFASLQPMLDEAVHTWDAMRGAIITSAKTITRLSTAPLFEGMKNGLGEVNAAFYDTDGNATELTNSIVDMGRTLSIYVVSGVNRVVDGVRWLRENGSGLLEDIFSFRMGALEDFRTMLKLNVEGPNAEMFSPLQAAFEDAGLRINSDLASVLDPIVVTVDWVASGLMSLSAAIIPLWDVIQKVAGIYEGAYLTVLPAVGEAFFMVSQAISDVVFSMAHLISDGIDLVIPHMAVYAQGIADLVIGIGHFLYPAIKIVGEVMGWLGRQIGEYVLPVFNFFIWVLGKAASAVGNFLKVVGDDASTYYGWNKQDKPQVQSADLIGDFFGNIMKTLNEQKQKRLEEEKTRDNAASGKRKAPAQRGGTTVNQDFRFSKFTIDQRFAEGYDPDRIAVMFARDVGRMGSQKLQSGFEPLFAVRG